MNGHIQRRGRRSWRLKFETDRNVATGRRTIYQATVRGSKSDAQRRLTELLSQRDTGTLAAPSKLLLRDYMAGWLAGWCRTNLSPKTAERYCELVENQIVPHLGTLPLQQLRPHNISKWHADLLADGRKKGGALSARTVGHAHRVLHKALVCALEDDLIARNPVAVKSPPKVERREIQILTPDQVTTTLRPLRGRSLYPLILLALATGARRGELLALRWSDLDLDIGTVRIERSVEQTKAGLRLKGPKTAAGRRTISLPNTVAAEMRVHRRHQLEQRVALGLGRMPDEALVFGLLEGGLRSPRAVSQEWARAVADLELPSVTFQALRHTHVSALISGGLDVVTVSRRLGHGSPAITLAVYSHLFSLKDGQAAAAIGITLAGALGDGS